MNISISTAKYEHLPEIEAIERACFSRPWPRAQLENQMYSDNCIFLVAQNENSVIMGYVGLMFVIDEGYISNIATAPSFRRLGVADALILELIRRAKVLALAFLTLEVRESNVAAITLYSKHGFAPVGTRKNYYAEPSENALLMTTFF